MKIAASYWMLEGGMKAKKPVVEALEEVKRAGFDAIELAIADKGVLTHETPQSECERIALEADKKGIEIASVASNQTWLWSPSASDASTRNRIIEFSKKALRVTRWLGTDVYLFEPGNVDIFFMPDSEVIPYDVCYERATAAVTQVLKAAEEVGVVLAIENVWNKFLLSPLEMKRFVESFNSVMVGAYFDVGNVMLTGYPEHWIKILGKLIKRVHVKDFKRSVGTVRGFVDLLEGDVDFHSVRAALSEIGYNGYITAEVLPYSPNNLKKTAQALKDIFA